MLFGTLRANILAMTDRFVSRARRRRSSSLLFRATSVR